MNQAINTLFKLCEDTEVSEVANLCLVNRANRILLFDVLPRISLQLLQAERHLALLTVEREDNCLHIVANVQELLC